MIMIHVRGILSLILIQFLRSLPKTSKMCDTARTNCLIMLPIPFILISADCPDIIIK